jgi:TrmH family RNA methyltransferase
VSDAVDIASPANPRIRALAALHKRRERDAQARFLVEGTREVDRALTSGRHLTELLICPDLAGAAQDDLMRRAVDAGVPVTRTSERPFGKLSRRQHPDGVLAAAEAFPTDLESLSAPPGLTLVAASIEKPGNLGAMLRTADATGAALVVADAAVDVFNPNVIRASQGAVFSVPLAAAASADVIRWLRPVDTVVVATPGAEQTFWEVDLSGTAALVVGSEHAGLPGPWLDAGTPVRIPMAGSADSLNTSVAAAVLLYEAVRQRASP